MQLNIKFIIKCISSVLVIDDTCIGEKKIIFINNLPMGENVEYMKQL